MILENPHWFKLFMKRSWHGNHFSIVALNTLRPRQDERHFADDIFTRIFFNENCCILMKFSLKYVRKGPIDNNPSLVQIMAWRRSGDKPLSGPMMVRLPTHICVTRPQWVKRGAIGDWRILVTKVMLFSLIKAWGSCWTSSQVTGDLRRHGAHVAPL